MKLLLYAGLVYLAGVAALLLLQPDMMFREDGSWKEFGVGRDPHHYTWLPLWLFAILWAILSYMIVLLFAGANMLPGITTICEEPLDLESLSSRKKSRTLQGLKDAEPGYYVLNMDKTGAKGVPKYIYLGPTAPNLVYNQGSTAPVTKLPVEVEEVGPISGEASR